jgi:hypothetical protein
MSLFEDTNPRELKELLRQINACEAALPDFQRDFVWDPNATQELIVSVASNYPAGSLLRIRNTHSLFACREFQGAQSLNGSKPTYLVLDGQQRLTSLYQAFYGVGEYRYYLNLRKLLDGDELEECIFHLRTTAKQAAMLVHPDEQAQELILPLDVLKDGTGGFLTWMLRAAERARTDSARIALQISLMKLREDYVQAIDDYRFPVVTLSDATGAEAVCTIFETLNRTGVKLSPFELLTARFWPKNVNLRHLLAQAQTAYPIITDFAVDPYYLLQVVALVARSTPSCKRGDVLDLTAADISEWWARASSGMARGLELLRDDCGVLIPGWLPYQPMLVPLAAVLAKLPPLAGPGEGARRQKLTRWFWCAVFGQTYESGANSQTARDFVDLVEWLNGGAEPASVASLQFDPLILRDTTPRQRALYRGTICLVLSREPRDFHNLSKITAEMIVDNHIDDHHIFPYAFLGKQNVPTRLRDCVLNRTLIDRKPNQRISARAPSDYMAEMRAELGVDKLTALLESHTLPAGPDSPFWGDDFTVFLDWRQEALWREIQRVTGLAADTSTPIEPHIGQVDVTVDTAPDIVDAAAPDDDFEDEDELLLARPPGITPVDALIPLTDREEIADAWKALCRSMQRGSQSIERTVGWPGGNGRFTLAWHPDHGIWGVMGPDFATGRYWFGLGTEDPEPVRMVGLVCEINPPIEGINRRCAGLFARDADGMVYLTHSGKVGGGRRGIGKRQFRAFFADGETRPVQWPNGSVTEVFPVTPIDADDLPTRLARFVHTVERFKQFAVGGQHGSR